LPTSKKVVDVLVERICFAADQLPQHLARTTTADRHSRDGDGVRADPADLPAEQSATIAPNTAQAR
jgi:hypothetical protein